MDNVPALTPAACVIVQNDKGEYLLLQRKFGGFCLPGGKVEDLEETIAGAMRELLEETGIEAQLTRDDFLGVVRSGISNRAVYIFKYSYTGSVILSSEHVAYIWTKQPFDGLTLSGNTDKMLYLDTCGKFQLEYYSPKTKQVVYSFDEKKYILYLLNDDTVEFIDSILAENVLNPDQLTDFIEFHYNFKTLEELVKFVNTTFFV